MKRQVWFETDLGYEATKETLLKSRSIIGDAQDYRGRLTFRFKNLKDFTVQITTKGKVGITYLEGSDYNVILEQLKPFLLKADGRLAEIINVKEFDKKPKLLSTESEPLKTALEHGIITKEDLENEQIIDFARSQIPGLASDSELSEIIKLVTAQGKIEALKKLKEASE